MTLAKIVWVLGRMTTYKLRKLGRFSHNQLLVTSQVSLCTSDGGAIVCMVASYHIDILSYHTENRLSGDNCVIWHILVLPRVGVQGDRPLKHTASIVIVHLVQNGYYIRGGWGVCVLANLAITLLGFHLTVS